jgi:hypothetical protein
LDGDKNRTRILLCWNEGVDSPQFHQHCDWVKNMTANVDNGDAQDRRNRRKLVRLLKGYKLELGYKPSRAKMYEGGRFSRRTSQTARTAVASV